MSQTGSRGIGAAIVVRTLREAGEALIASEDRAVALVADRRRRNRADVVDRHVKRALEELLHVALLTQATHASVGSGLRRDGSSLDEALASLDEPTRDRMAQILRRLNEYRGVGTTDDVLAVVMSLVRRRTGPRSGGTDT